MSATSSASSTPFSTPSRSRTIPRPPPSPVRPTSPTPSSASTLSAAAATPRRSLTPALVTGAASLNNSAAAGTSGALGTPPADGMRAQAAKGRARDLLRKHYGLGVGPPPPLSGPGKPLDPMDIDSPAFDAKSYYEQLITTSSLSTLLRNENKLLSEIRQLDGERQSLVYNHHHELIAASDTIAAMKTRAESIDSDLDKLRVAFSEISRLNDELGVVNSENDR
ncbi:Vps51/Vps67-domain-containing protein [Phellopilus nigrolimitatus]|nr:Vps51/Vps67-domain-containing protein [Phellopilus nigrolimitatus]